MASIDEAKIAIWMEVKARNVEIECAPYGCFAPEPPAKPNRKLERELFAELSMAEGKEVERRCRAIAKEYWCAGDNWRKNLWGGW